MNIALELKKGLTAEVYKFRRTFTLWLLILAPAFVPVINLIIFLSRGEHIVQEGVNPWDQLIKFSIDPGNFLFPFFVMIVALFVNNIEHGANTWKLIYTQPLRRTTVFLAKMKIFIFMILFSLMLFGAFTVLVGYIIHAVRPELGFDQAYDKSILFAGCLKIFLCSLGYASIQFAISQKWKNLILPLGVGLAGFISFMIVVQGWEYAPYHPYGYQILGLGSLQNPEVGLWDDMTFVWRSLCVGAVIFTLSGIDMARKRII